VFTDIAFITVNYNTLEHVRQLADFFQSFQASFTFSFTVVDNNSRDGSQEFLQSRKDINYVQAGENLGYGRAINRGAGATNSKYICVTNTDVVLNREALIALWRFLEGHPEVGVCAPRLKYQDGRDQGMVFEPSLLSFYSYLFAKAQAASTKQKIAAATVPIRASGVMGAFFFIRRSVLSASAIFDEDFFFFYEDTALSHTLFNRGVPCFVLPEATIVHIGGQSRSEASIALFYESRYLYLRKFYGPFHATVIYWLDRARILRKRLVYSLLSLFSSSERIKSKRTYYQRAWNASRGK
jgi:N-acetylglucosaminyl-diphospho-decaprenol L-rhamnosyltransferase